MSETPNSAKFVRDAREALLLTQTQLAKVLRLSSGRSIIGKYERGAIEPSPLVLQTLRWMLSPGRPDDWPLPPSASERGAQPSSGKQSGDDP